MTNIEKLARLIIKLGNADKGLRSHPVFLWQEGEKQGESEHE